LTYYAERVYNYTMRIIEEKADILCRVFSLLNEKEQEHLLGILEALLFAKLKKDAEKLSHSENEENKKGLV